VAEAAVVPEVAAVAEVVVVVVVVEEPEEAVAAEAEVEVEVEVVEEEEDRSGSYAARSPRTAPTRCPRRTSRAGRRPRPCRTAR
jgi:hypothetical protein